MRGDLVLRVIAKLLIPFILVFALYVQFHGDFGPGGGFQAGVIVAAAIIFHAPTLSSLYNIYIYMYIHVCVPSCIHTVMHGLIDSFAYASVHAFID